MDTKTIQLDQIEQEGLASNKTLVFGEDSRPQYVLMPFAKYSKLVGEADKDKIQARLKIETVI
jgi:hypothetical protein